MFSLLRQLYIERYRWHKIGVPGLINFLHRQQRHAEIEADFAFHSFLESTVTALEALPAVNRKK